MVSRFAGAQSTGRATAISAAHGAAEIMQEDITRYLHNPETAQFEILCAISQKLSALLDAVAPAEPTSWPTSYVRDSPSTNFTVSNVTLTATPSIIMGSDPNRVSFSLQIAVPNQLMVNGSQFAINRGPNGWPVLAENIFGIDGYIGELWAAVPSGQAYGVLIEQFADLTVPQVAGAEMAWAGGVRPFLPYRRN